MFERYCDFCTRAVRARRWLRWPLVVGLLAFYVCLLAAESVRDLCTMLKEQTEAARQGWPQRVAATALALCMMASLLPVPALAADVNDWSGAISSSETEITLAGDVTIPAETYDLSGKIVTFNGTATIQGDVSITGGTILRGAGNTRALFSVGSGASLTLENITVDGKKDTVTAYAPLVNITSGGTVTLGEGSVLTNNRSDGEGEGSAITVYAGTLKILGGKIIDNQCTASTGGSTIKTYYGSNVTMTDGEISGNSNTNHGGAIQLYGKGLSSESITATTTFTMEGGTIRDNTAGGVGGGVAVSAEAKFIMKGGTITGNSCGSGRLGGGVAFSEAASNNISMEISGSAKITGNTKNGASNNLEIGTANLLEVTGAMSGANIGITTSRSDAFTTSDSDITPAYYIAQFTSDNTSYVVAVAEDGKNLKLADSSAVCTVSFNANSGSGEMGDVQVEKDGTYTLPSCTFTAPTGKQFKGWAQAANGEVISGATITVSADTTLYAVWEDIPAVAPTITTSILPDGTVGTAYSQTLAATGTAPITWAIESGNLPTGLSLNENTGEISGTPAAAGTFTFTVKATNNGGSNTQELSITIVAAPVYSISADTTTINFGSVQTDYTAPEAKTVTITNTGNRQITLTQPTAANYTVGTLSKTDLEPNGTATFTVQPKDSLAAGTYDTTITVEGSNSANVSISVKFSVVQIYTVSFDSNGGEGTMTPQTFTAGQAQTLTANTFTRTGYTFAGWNTVADGSGTGYADKESITLTVDLPLYARWIPAAPTGLSGVKPTSSANNDGKITGTTAAMEYSTTADFASVTDCGDGETTGLSSGTYYVRVKATQSEPAGTAATVTVPAYQPPYTPPSTPPSPSEPPVVQITVPVSGEENAVHVEAKVKGESASVEPVDENEVAHIAEGETEMPVTMDFSVLKNAITEVKIPTQSIELISETANDPETAVTGLKIDLTYADIEFDAAALAVIVEAAKNTDDITIIVDERAAEHLTEAQRETVKDMPNALILEATVLVNGKPVHNFFGGKATVTFPYQLAAGQSAGFITVWHIADDGAKEAMRTYYDAESEEVYFAAPHLSHYVVTGDEANFAHICPSEPYTDIDQSLWYHEAVDYVIENELMIGYGNGIFKPNADTTRAMLTVMLWRLNGSPVVNYLLDFEDVEEGQWYTEAIRWAKSEGIATGYGNGYFGTNDAITREQMVTILWRYAQYKGIDVSVGENTNILSYDDAFDVAEYAIPAMQWACGAGLMQGDGVNLTPKADATRAQAAALFQRFCENVAEK